MKPNVNYEHQKIKFEDSISWPEGSFDSIMAEMEGYKEKYKHVIDATVDYKWSGYEEIIFCVTGFTLETDEQRDVRVEWEEEQLAEWQEQEDYKAAMMRAYISSALEKERKEYERLKSKFEN